MYPGDPTTPGYPSYENSTRSEGKNIPAIPSLPISAENAGKLKGLLDSGNWTGVVRLNNQGGYKKRFIQLDEIVDTGGRSSRY